MQGPRAGCSRGRRLCHKGPLLLLHLLLREQLLLVGGHRVALSIHQLLLLLQKGPRWVPMRRWGGQHAWKQGPRGSHLRNGAPGRLLLRLLCCLMQLLGWSWLQGLFR